MKKFELNQTYCKVLLTISDLNKQSYYPLNEGLYKILVGIMDEEVLPFANLASFGTLTSYSSKKICHLTLMLFRQGLIGKVFDPETKKFGALGHEIINKDTNEIIDIENGLIYYSYITGISMSNNGNPGEKEAQTNKDKTYGTINENTKSGIFGDYTYNIDNSNLYDVAKEEEIKIGKANIYTVIEGENLESFEIQIEKLNFKDDTKNIVFKITDENLLNKTGGIVQGMSGSPIVQDGKIIGAVTHVIVNDCTRGYGIFITNMLKEAEN